MMPGSRRGKPIDWPEVHRRLERLQGLVAREWAPDAEARAAILQQRARALAAHPAIEAAGESVEVVEFQLAQERYGVATVHVREVFPLVELAPVPCTPAFVAGIVNARGEILSVIDLRKFFDLPPAGITDLNKVIVLQSEFMVFGILADAVLGVRSIARRDILPPLPTLTGVREDYLLGVTGEVMAILDGAKLLGDSRLVVSETVERG